MRILINDKNAVYIISSESRCENKMYFYSITFLKSVIRVLEASSSSRKGTTER